MTKLHEWRSVVGVIRAPFLLLALVPPIVVAVEAQIQDVSTNFVLIGAGLMLCVLAHIAVNALNEYQDFKSGLDFLTTRSPFNGGSGTLLAVPQHASLALWISAGALILVLVGGYLVASLGSLRTYMLGLIGVTIIVSYTRWLTKRPILCLVAPGFAFGPIMVLGMADINQVPWTANLVLQSFVLFCLVSCLLLINQIPDYEADKKVGRRHWVIAYGVSSACWVHNGLNYLCFAAIGLYWVVGLIPIYCAIAALPLLYRYVTPAELAKAAATPDGLIPFQQAQVLRCLSVPLLLAAVTLISNP
jgi:1,4-dihydroxy-2-naphthoate octaprenyltransferase